MVNWAHITCRVKICVGKAQLDTLRHSKNKKKKGKKRILKRLLMRRTLELHKSCGANTRKCDGRQQKMQRRFIVEAARARCTNLVRTDINLFRLQNTIDRSGNFNDHRIYTKRPKSYIGKSNQSKQIAFNQLTETNSSNDFKSNSHHGFVRWTSDEKLRSIENSDLF